MRHYGIDEGGEHESVAKVSVERGTFRDGPRHDGGGGRGESPLEEEIMLRCVSECRVVGVEHKLTKLEEYTESGCPKPPDSAYCPLPMNPGATEPSPYAKAQPKMK